MDKEEITKEVEGAEVKTPDTPETFTKEEVDKMLQSESDRRVSEALKKKESEWEEQFKQKLEQEKSEAEKLASMSAEERAMTEFETEKAKWVEEKKQFEKERMKLEATKLLSSEGLPVSFVDYVVGDTAEEVTENINAFKTEWKKALESAVSDKLRGKVPTGSALQSKDILSMTKTEFGKLPYKERARMLSVDPSIVSKLKD